ncbi:nucleotidyltransferase family protein [Sphingomonas sp. MMS24-J13]|uniref:nucleotidyltransferase family protein n=1 Tax=Sphingomonas sp. MMS24-J13 TaxID=3238686 RepID=UPI00384BD8BE
MIRPEAVAVILLAAGLSSRFGPRDKLAVPIDGLPLGLHAARMLAPLPFARKVAVTAANGPDFAAYGFTAIVNRDPAAGQSGSIRLGLAEARTAQPQAVLIALADMPFVPVAHIHALLARFGGNKVVASTDGYRPGPPALFDASFWPILEGLSGDSGARALLRDARLVSASPAELADIDTPLDLPSSATDSNP